MTQHLSDRGFLMGIRDFIRRVSGRPALSPPIMPPPEPLSPEWNEAMSTLAWSLREIFKHRGHTDQNISDRDKLGWSIAQILSGQGHSREANTAEFLNGPLRSAAGHRACEDPIFGSIEAQLARINDPVISALWEIGTLRAVSDLLAHLILRSERPGCLLWNTADYCKNKHDVDLYVINAEYVDARGYARSEPVLPPLPDGH